MFIGIIIEKRLQIGMFPPTVFFIFRAGYSKIKLDNYLAVIKCTFSKQK